MHDKAPNSFSAKYLYASLRRTDQVEQSDPILEVIIVVFKVEQRGVFGRWQVLSSAGNRP